jgi:mono/diheme cytochrome c family protein
VRGLLRLLVLVALVALSLWGGLWGPRAPHPTAVQRGAAVAAANGCFSCHGPGGTGGVGNAGHPDGDVPGFTKGTPMMYADSPEDVHAWIKDGITAKKKASTSYMAKRKKGALHMPDFGDRLGAGQIDDVAAYVRATSGEFLPADSVLDSTLTRGIDLGKSLGCTSCHGAMGAGGPANPGSLKGYVPGWNGVDFPELVRDSTEFRLWVQEGTPARFKSSKLAMYFLRGGKTHMPAYHDRVSDSQLKDLWAFIRVMRESPETAWAR